MGAASLAFGAGVLCGNDAQAAFGGYPFKLGVASGDPLPDGVVLWTRLAPRPLQGGGMPESKVAVRWEVSEDEGFQRVVRTGVALARPDLAHSVHVEVSGLRPARYYWYRFKAGREISATGRTKTAPAFGAAVSGMSFAFASCQNWEAGFYAAYRAMAAEDLDLVVHLGDYLYEGAAMGEGVRSHRGEDPTTLADCRNRHALYKTDKNLQAAHAAHPWAVTWDDHEVNNNHAKLSAGGGSSPAAARRRAAAYRAYYEHLPLRRSSLPSGTGGRIYRRLTYGDLVRISDLDTRQYRTDQPCGDGLKARCAAALDPDATLTGPAQEKWLLDGLGSSPARWNVIAQQVVIAQYDHRDGRGRPLQHGRLGRLRCGQKPRPRLPPQEEAQKPRRYHRRRPLFLGRRPQGGFPRRGLEDPGHRVRRDLHHLPPRPRRRADHNRRPPGEPPREVLRR